MSGYVLGGSKNSLIFKNSRMLKFPVLKSVMGKQQLQIIANYNNITFIP